MVKRIAFRKSQLDLHLVLSNTDQKHNWRTNKLAARETVCSLKSSSSTIVGMLMAKQSFRIFACLWSFARSTLLLTITVALCKHYMSYLTSDMSYVSMADEKHLL